MPKINIKDYVVDFLGEQKIEDIIVIDTSKISSMSDWVIIGSGRSSKQIESAIENLKIDLKNNELGSGKISGVGNDGWIIYDLGNVIVHVFIPAVRDIYRLEELLNPTLKKKIINKKEDDKIKEAKPKKLLTKNSAKKEIKNKLLKKPLIKKASSTKRITKNNKISKSK